MVRFFTLPLFFLIFFSLSLLLLIEKYSEWPFWNTLWSQPIELQIHYQLICGFLFFHGCQWHLRKWAFGRVRPMNFIQVIKSKNFSLPARACLFLFTLTRLVKVLWDFRSSWNLGSGISFSILTQVNKLQAVKWFLLDSIVLTKLFWSHENDFLKQKTYSR